MSKFLVKEWWPKPKIKSVPKKFWGSRWINLSTGCLHKYECYSFSSTGFYTSEEQLEGLPSLKCMSYGETPEQAYTNWCRLFAVWNKEEDWIK